MEKKFNIFEGNSITDIQEWIANNAGKLWTGIGDEFVVTVNIEVIPKKKAPFISKWNQCVYPTIFYRSICPICGAAVPKDDGYGSMEISEQCPVDGKHYSRFSNIFADSVRIQGKCFEPNQVKEIDEWLEEVGELAYVK